MTDIGPVVVTPDGLAMLVAYRMLPHPSGGWGSVRFPDGSRAVYPLADLYVTGVASEVEFRELAATHRALTQQLRDLGLLGGKADDGPAIPTLL